MSVTDTFELLGARLLGTDPSPSRPLVRVITDLSEKWGEADLPLALLALSTENDGALKVEALGLGRHDYTVIARVLLGSAQTDIHELHDRAKPWPEAILRALAADMTLTAAVAFVGYGDGDNTLARYRIGWMPVGAGRYWGLKVWIPVTEKPTVTMG